MAEDFTQTQIEILNEMRRSPEQYFSVKSIGDVLHLSQQDVNAGLRELVRWGYRFETNAHGRIKLLSAPDVLFPHEVSYGLKTHIFGADIYSFRRVVSTNTMASRYAEKNAREGTVILAERQTGGKGRLGRSWWSPPKIGIYLSLILRPRISPADAPGLSLIAALSVAEAIRSYPQLDATIKWPNDVLIGGKKVAGVLTELAAELDRVRYVIVGIGVNANHAASDFPKEITADTTSLRLESGQQIDRIKFVQAMLTKLERRYQAFVKRGLEAQIEAIKEHSSILSRKVTFKYDGKIVSGIAVDIDAQGRLVVDVDGSRLLLSSGEITLSERQQS